MKKLTIIQKWSNQSYNVSIEPNKSIRIDCIYTNVKNPKPTSVLFKIGDRAEYDSYNMHYLGTITSISEKTVTFDIDNSRPARRLKLQEFCWRNWGFDLAKIEKYNSEEMMCI